MTPDERDSLLIRLDERVEHLIHVIDGNGQPGLSQRVSVLEGAREEARTAGASAGRKQSLLITLGVGALAIVAQMLGLPVPLG